MRAADEAAAARGTSTAELMERAGRAVARAVIGLIPRRYGRRVLVVCGKGNNGGDGFVAARVLATEGVGVTCRTVFDPAEARGAALEHLRRMERAGVPARPWEPEDAERGYDAVVDAIFGTGFRGAAEGTARQAIEAIDGRANVVSVDIPSGVDGTTGRVEGAAVHAHTTVALGAEKWGTALSPGSLYAGRVLVADIRIPLETSAILRGGEEETAADAGRADPLVEVAEAADVAAVLGSIARPPDAHKRSSGSVAVLAGSDAMRGAALLCARGAARMGSGYVTIGSTAAVKDAAAARIPEVLCDVVAEDVLEAESLERFAPVLEKADAVAIGPGVGRGDRQRALVERALGEIDAPLVLDADALNVLAEEPAVLTRRAAPTVLTPHPAELARLLDARTSEVASDPLDAALEASSRFGAVVLLKGHRTIVSGDKGSAAIVVPAGGPELATAGTGDVLTGALAALLARAPDPSLTYVAAFVHAVAGSIAADRVGSEGVVAWDVAEALPDALRRLTLRR